MNALTFNLSESRRRLVQIVEDYNNLLDELDAESVNLDGWAKKQFDKRMWVLEKLLNTVIEYDVDVMKYIHIHPDSQNVQYYKEKLEVARRYIIANGLDWSNVTWGKVSDYNR